VVIVHLGLEGASTAFVGERRATVREIAAAASVLAPISGAVGAVALVGFYLVTRNTLLDGLSWSAFLFAPALLPIQLHVLWALNLFALGGRVIRAQLAQFAGAALQVLLLLPVALAGELTLLYALGTYAAFIVAPWVLLLWWSRAFAPLRPAVDRDLIRRLVSFGVKLQFGQVFFYLLFRSDALLVNFLLGADDVGVYSLAVILGEAVMLLTMPLVLAALPTQSGLGSAEVGLFSFKVARFNGVFAIALSAAAAAVMWFVIPLVYGEEFAGAYVALVALLPGVSALAVVRPLGNWLVRENRPWRISALGATAFAANLGMNLVLVPSLGIVGASVSSSVAYIGLAAALIAWGLRSAGLPARRALTPSHDDFATVRRVASALRARLRPR